MFEFLSEIVVAFEVADPDARGTKPSAAPEKLFKVDEDCMKLKPIDKIQTGMTESRVIPP